MNTTKEKRDQFIARGSEIEEDLYKLFPKDADIVIGDIGACDGLSSIIYMKMFPNSTVVAFEPVEDNFREMYNNFHEYGMLKRAKVFNVALSDKRGTMSFYKSNGQAPGIDGWNTGNKSGSLLPPKKHLDEHKWCRFDNRITVDVYPLDSLQVKKIDFAHIDVQGNELKVLKGGKKIFETTMAIWIEVATIELYEGQVLKNDLSRYLNDMGFKCIKDTCEQKSGDMLWVRR